MKLRKYISSFHLYVMADWLECVKWAKNNEFDGIEFFGNENGCAFENIPLSRLDEVARYAKENSIELSLHPWADWKTKDDEELYKIYAEYAERCARMGMKYINMHMHFITARDMGMERLFRVTDRILPILKENGIVLLYENVPPHGIRELGSEVGDFDALFEYYKDEPMIQMNIDTGHAYITDTIGALAEAHGSRWTYTHINDNFGVKDDHVAPGVGTLDFGKVASASKDAGYTGPLMMEYHEKGLETGMKTLKKAYGDFGYEV